MQCHQESEWDTRGPVLWLILFVITLFILWMGQVGDGEVLLHLG